MDETGSTEALKENNTDISPPQPVKKSHKLLFILIFLGFILLLILGVFLFAPTASEYLVDKKFQITPIPQQYSSRTFATQHDALIDQSFSPKEKVGLGKDCGAGFYCTNIRYLSPQKPHATLETIRSVRIFCNSTFINTRTIYSGRNLLYDVKNDSYYVHAQVCGTHEGGEFFGPFKITNGKNNISESADCGEDPRKWELISTYKEAFADPLSTCALQPENESYYTVPRGIAKLTKTKYLYLSDDLLKELPDEIGQMTDLEYLYLSFNDLHKLPVSLFSLPNLKLLDVSGNKFTKEYEQEVMKNLPKTHVIIDRQRTEEGNYQTNQ